MFRRHSRPKFRSPLTPTQMSSFEDEDFHQDYSGIETKRVPHAKRRLMTEELSPPGCKKLHSLHDAPSTPSPKDDSPFPPGRKIRYDELKEDNTFKNKEVLEKIDLTGVL
ncbi:hypothetical protein MKW98_032512 [Papaver atlanticum]|uniref:Uncharacterized protein n=1 Tax=Papaver atlanticum TaxID=357466 RepID=A0AAD4XLQ4_9MAGN|nr:hypothetical protein MKW98_032512 [Papaver atlanticum]